MSDHEAKAESIQRETLSSRAELATSAKATAGPWERSDRSRWVVLSTKSPRKAVCVMKNYNEHDSGEQEADANARLIAAAPQMREALEALLAQDDDVAPSLSWDEARALARAALRAANGEDSNG